MEGECKTNNFFNQMCEMTGYCSKTTFWMDFTIADMFGEESIRNTFGRAMHEWKDNVEFMTELVMVLKWKSWYWNGARCDFSESYCELCVELFDDLRYFLRTVD